MTTLSPILKQATPVVVDHALGSWIWATDGRRYLDFTTGIGVTSTGHCHPAVVAAAHAPTGVTPDILITAKGLASGFPISAIAAPSELMGKAWPGSQGGTYGGNAVAAAAAVATLTVVQDEGLVENARVRGEELRTGLSKLQQDHPEMGDVRGLGLMQAVEFMTEDGRPDPARATAVQQRAIDHDLLLLTCGTRGNVVRVIPPLVATAEEIGTGLAAFGAAVDAVSGAPSRPLA